MNAFDRLDQIFEQWERVVGPLPPDARHLFRTAVREIVLDCAAQCDTRSRIRDYHPGIRNEATKCGMQIRHNMLCREGETVCLRCDGRGCVVCGYEGIRKLREV